MTSCPAVPGRQKIGNPIEKGYEIWAVATCDTCAKVLDYINVAKADGAIVIRRAADMEGPGANK